MAYIGNSYEIQRTTPSIDYFNGNGVTTTFTLSKPVISNTGMIVVVNNVPQNPASAFALNASNQIVFTEAPSAGTNNIYVQYNAVYGQVGAVGQGTVGTSALGSISNINSIGRDLTLQTNGTTDITLGIDGTIRAHGSITAGEVGSTGGSTLLKGFYGNGSLTNFGTEYSSGGPFVGYGVTPGKLAADTFQSSTSITIDRSALIMAGSTFKFWSGGSQTLATGAAATLTEKMRIDSAGRVTTPNQPHVFCKVYGTTIPGYFGLNAVSSRGGLSVGTAGGASAVYAPVAGVYAISFNGIANSTAGRVDMNMYKNGGTWLSSLNEANGDGYHYRTISVTAYLNANDYIQMYQTAGAFYYGGGTGSWEWGHFSMSLIG